MEVINLKKFREQIKRDNSIRKVREQVKARVITLIECKMTNDNLDLLEEIIQNIKDLI